MGPVHAYYFVFSSSDSVSVCSTNGFASPSFEFNSLAKSVNDPITTFKTPLSMQDIIVDKLPLLAVDKNDRSKSSSSESNDTNNNNTNNDTSSDSNSSSDGSIKKIIF